MSYKAESWFLLFLLTLIWGSSFILIKKGLETFSPFQVASLRIGFAALCLLPVAFTSFKKLNARQYLYIFLFGLCNAGLPAFLFATAQTRVNSSTAGILNALTPIFTLVVGVFFFKVKLTNRKLAGVAIGFVGAAMLVLFRNGFTVNPLSDTSFIYTLLIVFATLLYGFSGNILKDKLQNVPGYIISSYAYLFFAAPMAVFLFSGDFIHKMQINAIAWQSLGYLAVLGVGGSALAIIFFSRLIQHSNALFASFVTYLLPFVAILWGLFVGEKVSALSLISLGIILFGIFITTVPKRQPKKNTPENNNV